MSKSNFLSMLKPSNAIALEYGDESISYADLIENVQLMAKHLKSLGCSRIGLYGDNSIEWIVADLAALDAGVTLVPIPMFFSDEQINYSVEQAQLEVIINIRDSRLVGIMSFFKQEYYKDFQILHLNYAKPEELVDIRKITYTSGSTGRPKGACLIEQAMIDVAASLAEIVPKTGVKRHLCLLPLSTLLENVAGVYVSLLNGLTVVIPPQDAVGLSGSSNLDITKMFHSLKSLNANTAIMTPQLLQALVFHMGANQLALPELTFLAVGGSKLSGRTLAQATALKIPIYEGYGLSEACSVVCCNEPNNIKEGSIGKPLAHAKVKIADDGEILVSGSTFNGYLNLEETVDEDGFWPTGDLGSIDDEGFVFIKGRKKNLIISSFGRNIAPEWVEAELTTQSSILQAAVFGDGEAFISAVLFSVDPDQSLSDLAQLNKSLPDYAQVKKIIFSEVPFSKENGLLTENGRIKRFNIEKHFAKDLASIYKNSENKEVDYEY